MVLVNPWKIYLWKTLKSAWISSSNSCMNPGVIRKYALLLLVENIRITLNIFTIFCNLSTFRVCTRLTKHSPSLRYQKRWQDNMVRWVKPCDDKAALVNSVVFKALWQLLSFHSSFSHCRLVLFLSICSKNLKLNHFSGRFC